MPPKKPQETLGYPWALALHFLLPCFPAGCRACGGGGQGSGLGDFSPGSRYRFDAAQNCVARKSLLPRSYRETSPCPRATSFFSL